jgi:hypothetical protein
MPRRGSSPLAVAGVVGFVSSFLLAGSLLLAGSFLLAGCGGSAAEPPSSQFGPLASVTVAPETTADSTATSTADSAAASTAVSAAVSTIASTVAGVATSVGDLLTADEVAEVEQALDDLDSLLAEIDADLADVPDP